METEHLRVSVDWKLSMHASKSSSCVYCQSKDHETGDHSSGITKRQAVTIGTRWYPETEKVLGVPNVSCDLGPFPSIPPEEVARHFNAVVYAADETRKLRLDPFLPARRICNVCRRELLPDEQLPPLRAIWDHRAITLFFCDECAAYGPLAPVSESYEALSTADDDRRREAREELLAGAREQRQKVREMLRIAEGWKYALRIKAAYTALTPLEKVLLYYELWLRNVPDTGDLTTEPQSRLFTVAARKRLKQESEMRGKARFLAAYLQQEGISRSRVDTLLSLYVELDRLQPKMQHPGDDATSSATTGHEWDQPLSIVANRIDGNLPARGAYLPPPILDPEEILWGDEPQTKDRKVRPGYVADAPAERKERERAIVADFMLTAHRAEFDDVEQNIVLTWLGGAKQPELAKLSGWSQPTISRLLRKVLSRAIALQLPAVIVNKNAQIFELIPVGGEGENSSFPNAKDGSPCKE
jgi:hypothetical protein